MKSIFMFVLSSLLVVAVGMAIISRVAILRQLVLNQPASV
jgi:hypothetical protein